MALGRFGSAVLVAGGLLCTSMSGAASAREAALASSGLPVPRYVSLKTEGAAELSFLQHQPMAGSI